MLAQKRLANSVFICIDLNIIQTSPSFLRDLKSLNKKPWLRLSFLSWSLNAVNTRDSVCIIYVHVANPDQICEEHSYIIYTYTTVGTYSVHTHIHVHTCTYTVHSYLYT